VAQRINKTNNSGEQTMSTKELQEKLLASMKQWQKIEDASVLSAAGIKNKTENPLIRLVMDIIQNDSDQHYRVQQFIIDSLEKTYTLTPDDLGTIWEEIEKHIAIEKKMAAQTMELAEAIKGKRMVVQEYLLNYLKEDEKKHDELLSSMNKIKSGMYPYG
jgi:hypothetical protein